MSAMKLKNSFNSSDASKDGSNCSGAPSDPPSTDRPGIEAGWGSEEVDGTAWDLGELAMPDPVAPPLAIIRNYYDRESLIEQDAVIICIDLEAHCHNQNFRDHQAGVKNTNRMMCELGFAIADSRDIRDTEPDDRYQNMWSQISAYNIIPVGNEHRLAKGEYRCRRPWCKVGSPDQFQYGYPRYVPKDKVKASFFKTIRSFVQDGPGMPERPVIWMFFAMSHDVQWLGEAGIDLKAEFPSSTFLDIQSSPSARIAKGSKRQCAASDLFSYLGIPITRAHNGGNDAVYELRSWLAEIAMSDEQRACLPLPDMEETIPAPTPREPRARKNGRKQDNQYLPHGVRTQRAPEPVVASVRSFVDFEVTNSEDFPTLGAAKSTNVTNKQGAGGGKNKKKFQKLDLS